MKIGHRGDVAATFRTLFEAGAIAGLTDEELLERSASGRGPKAELAFAALVERHGPMVLRVCKKALGDPDDAHDAFQSTFFVLARKADSIRDRRSVASWLHGVALRVSSASRSALARRRRHERARAACSGSVLTLDEPDDLGSVLHEEVGKLPSRYRAAVVLCYLEGMSHEQAAGHLDCPVGTVKSRLAWARDRLRDRLVRRGLAPSAGAVAAILAAESAQAARALPSSWVDQTTGAAMEFASGSSFAGATAGTVPASASAITARGVLRAMKMMSTIKVAATASALFLTATGLSALAQYGGKPVDGDRIQKLESKLDRLIDALEKTAGRPAAPTDGPATRPPADVEAPRADPSPTPDDRRPRPARAPRSRRAIPSPDAAPRPTAAPAVPLDPAEPDLPEPPAPPRPPAPPEPPADVAMTERPANDARLDRIEQRLDRMEQRLDRLERGPASARPKAEGRPRAEEEIDEIEAEPAIADGPEPESHANIPHRPEPRNPTPRR